MAISPGLSTLAMSVASSTNIESHFVRPRSVSRSDSLSSSEDSVTSQTRGMAIHIRRAPYAPPALPPPTYIEPLDHGRDVGYELANHDFRTKSGLPSIPEGSSLRGGTFVRPGQSQPYKQSMDLDEDSGRRPPPQHSTKMSQPAHAEGGAGAHASKAARRAHSPSNSSAM